MKTLVDEQAIIKEAWNELSSDQLKLSFLQTLAELEDNQRWRTGNFPHSRIHKIRGIKKALYRADITKKSGWRIHIQLYGNAVYLISLIAGKDHDKTRAVVKAHSGRLK